MIKALSSRRSLSCCPLGPGPGGMQRPTHDHTGLRHMQPVAGGADSRRPQEHRQHRNLGRAPAAPKPWGASWGCPGPPGHWSWAQASILTQEQCTGWAWEAGVGSTWCGHRQGWSGSRNGCGGQRARCWGQVWHPHSCSRCGHLEDRSEKEGRWGCSQLVSAHALGP